MVYKSLTPANCYIIVNGSVSSVQTVNQKLAGDTLTCNIEASQPGNATYAAAAPVTRLMIWRKAPMIITPYFADSASRTAALRGVGTVIYAAGTTYNFVSSLLYLSGQNSGLASIGHLLSAVSLTPTVCSVEAVAIQDRGSLFTWASVKMLQKSSCTVRWSFAGTDTRAATSRDMSVLVSK